MSAINCNMHHFSAGWRKLLREASSRRNGAGVACDLQAEGSSGPEGGSSGPEGGSSGQQQDLRTVCTLELNDAEVVASA